MADYYSFNPIPPPAGAAKILNPEALKKLSESQIWRQPGTNAIYKLATAPLAPLPMQAGEANAMTNAYTAGGYSAQDAAKKTAEITATRAPAPAGSTAPPNLTLAPTGQQFSTSPQTPAQPTQTPSLSQPQSPAGSQSAFGTAFGQLMAQGQKSQVLQDQKNKLVQQLYDRPLTPEELRTLSPAQQEAIRSGDKSLLEFQVLTINDMIKGRADENTKALTYMMDGYKLDQAEVEKKRNQAYASFTNIIEKYPDTAAQLSPEGFAAIQRGEMPPTADIQKVYAAYRTSLGAEKSAGAKTASIQEYEYAKANGYTGTYSQYQNEDANRKAIATKLSNSNLDFHTQSAVDSLSKGFDNSQIVKDFNVVQEKKITVDSILAGNQTGPSDVAVIYEFMKALDPTSVVRESEYASAAQSGNIFTGTLAQFNGLFKASGGKLSDQVKKDFQAVINQKYAVKEKQFDNLYSETARKIDMKTGAKDGSDYLTNYKQATVTGSPGTQSEADPLGLGFSGVGGGTQNAQKSEQLTSIPTDVKWGEGTRKTNVGQCGALVNDITGLKMGDSLNSKIAVCDKSITPDNVEVGNAFVQSVANDPEGHGHTGIVNFIGQDAQGRYALVTEANYHLNGETTHDRKIYLSDPKIKGFAKPQSWNLA